MAAWEKRFRIGLPTTANQKPGSLAAVRVCDGVLLLQKRASVLLAAFCYGFNINPRRAHVKVRRLKATRKMTVMILTTRTNEHRISLVASRSDFQAVEYSRLSAANRRVLSYLPRCLFNNLAFKGGSPGGDPGGC